MRAMSSMDTFAAGKGDCDKCAGKISLRAHHLPMRAKSGKELTGKQRSAEKVDGPGTKRIERGDQIAAVDG